MTTINRSTISIVERTLGLSRASLALGIALATGGCTNGPSGAQDADPPGRGAESPVSSDGATQSNDEPAAGQGEVLVSATFVETWLGKPPMALNYFDLTFENPSSEPRWVVFTEVFHYEGREDPVLAEGDVAELSATVVGLEPRVVLVQGVGANFQAVKLEGSAKLNLERVPIQSWWEAAPSQDEIEVIVATQLRIDGKPIESLLSEDVLCAAGRARVPASGKESGGASWHPADLASASPLELEIESRASTTVTFAAP